MTSPVPVVSTDDEGLAAAADVLRNGGVVVFPTDTVYGLAALAAESAAIDRLFELKDRPAERSIAVLIADVDQANELAALTDTDRELMGRHWPGALTVVVHRRPEVDWIGAADGTVGVRCPDQDFVRALATAVGPLATTSANRSGEPTEVVADAAAASLVGQPDLVVDGGLCAGVASTVVRRDGDAWTVLRQGSLEI